MNICVSSGFYGGDERNDSDISAKYRFIAQIGFREVDQAMNTDMFTRDGWEARARASLQAAADAGLTVRYAHLPFDYPKTDDAEAWARFRLASLRAMDFAKEAHVEAAVIHPRTHMRANYRHAEEKQSAYAFLAEYVREAEARGVKLALENMRGPGVHSSPDVRRFLTETDDLIEMADTYHIGICWDTGHANISAQEQYPSLLKVGKRLVMLHLNDNLAQEDIHIAPFVGTVDWVGVARALGETGYRGGLNFEITTHRVPMELRADYGAFIFRAASCFADMVERARAGQ